MLAGMTTERLRPLLATPGQWLLVPIIAAAGLNNILLKQESARPLWRSLTEEISSSLVVLALLPVLFHLARRWPAAWPPRPAWFLRHLGASIAFCLVHVAAMNLIRVGVFAAMGETYRPGPVLEVLAYEYVKDAGAYALILCFAWILDRLPAPAKPVVPQPSFAVRTMRGTVIVPVTEIIRIEAAGNYATLVTPTASLLHRASMREIEAALPEDSFARAHRSHIVRLDAVAAIRRDGEQHLQLANGDIVPLGRTYARARDWCLRLPSSDGRV